MALAASRCGKLLSAVRCSWSWGGNEGGEGGRYVLGMVSQLGANHDAAAPIVCEKVAGMVVHGAGNVGVWIRGRNRWCVRSLLREEGELGP